jgi:hypothetical protein
MDLTASLVPKKSLGGICIGEYIADVIPRLSSDYKIERNKNSTTINSGLVTAYHDDSGLISSLSCNSKFKGNYLNKLWPGMTVSDVLKHTSTQMAWSGFVQVDCIDGIGLFLAEDHDDFERITDEFDGSHVFEELWIYE